MKIPSGFDVYCPSELHDLSTRSCFINKCILDEYATLCEHKTKLPSAPFSINKISLFECALVIHGSPIQKSTVIKLSIYVQQIH